MPTPQDIPADAILPPLCRGSQFGFRWGPTTPPSDFTDSIIRVYLDFPKKKVRYAIEDFVVAADGSYFEFVKDGAWTSLLASDGDYNVVVEVDDLEVGFMQVTVWSPGGGPLPDA
jgi:hypothetical protein